MVAARRPSGARVSVVAGTRVVVGTTERTSRGNLLRCHAKAVQGENG